MSRKLNKLYLMTTAKKEIPGLLEIHDLSVRENARFQSGLCPRNSPLIMFLLKCICSVLKQINICLEK